ncbi:MAG TPA: Dyp-type peroxidase [Chitinophagaceae bacterium]|nr:Dyp-type peroxidase [Chitinophagaceae bacterium]
METLELDDIQGYIIRGYKHMRHSRYLLLQVTDQVKARAFIGQISPLLTNVTHYAKTSCLNIAFTPLGLSALGLKESNLQNFPREFREGMTTPHRQRLLGDEDTSSPEKWLWGGPRNEEMHILFMIFGAEKGTVMNHYNKFHTQFSQSGLNEIWQMDGQTLPRNKEHFGFRDGISQPIIKGSGKTGPDNDYINAGEFILGYRNEYEVYPDTPLLAEDQGNPSLLAEAHDNSGKKDLGRNGSYMVMRQLQQDVDGYWTFLNEKTKNENGSVNPLESSKLAAKMMGRWPSGAPILKFPDSDPGHVSDDNDFNYAKIDPDGMRCPFGSHLRRTNPRDSFEDNNKGKSLRLTKRHRIIRRARLYGVPYEGSPFHHTPEGEVGLLFSCFNADISRQFEFIQYTWANYPKFKQLYNDPDPIIGVRETAEPGTEQNFTIPSQPVNTYITGLKRFVTVKGGGYFFFPSITAVKFLSTL